MYRHGFHDHTRNEDIIKATAAATGVAFGYLGPTPAGYCWYVERLTTNTNTAAGTPALEVYVLGSVPTTTPVDKMGRQDYTPTAANDVLDEVNPIALTEGQYLCAVWTGCTSGDLCQLSAQIAVHSLRVAAYGPTHDELAALRAHEIEAAHERESAHFLPGV